MGQAPQCGLVGVAGSRREEALTMDKRSFVIFEACGAVRIDLKGWLRSPAGRAKLQSLKRLMRVQHEALRFPRRSSSASGERHD